MFGKKMSKKANEFLHAESNDKTRGTFQPLDRDDKPFAGLGQLAQALARRGSWGKKEP